MLLKAFLRCLQSFTSMRILAFILIVFCLTSCVKRYEGNVNAPCSDSCTTFKVKVTTGENSAIPLGGADVELSWSQPGIPFGNAGRLIAKGKSAVDGTISFSFNAYANELRAGKFNVIVTKGAGYLDSEKSYYEVSRFDTTVNAQVHLPAKATLKLVLKNFFPNDSADYFSVNSTYNSYGTTQKVREFFTLDGKRGYSSFHGKQAGFSRYELSGSTVGDQYNYFIIIRKKAGIRADMVDSIFIPKGTVRTYEIEY